MRQVLFILLVFISFQGFSQTQTVKLNRIGLEVMKTDLGEMTWEDAKTACEKLGKGWRLPTIEELKIIYKKRNKIGGFNSKDYWSSTEVYCTELAWTFNFGSGPARSNGKYFINYVRAVRDVK